MRITTRAQLETWLSDHAHLEHATFEDVQPRATQDELPETVILRMSIQTTPGWQAGDVVEVQRLTLTAQGVTAFSFEDWAIGPGHCCEGAQIVQSDAPIAFELDVPGPLRLECAALAIEKTVAQETIPARFSELHCTASARHPLFSPHEWQARLTELGAHLAWRFYHGPPTPTAEVPEDYTGWFLQHVDRFETTTGGLYFGGCAQRDGRMTVSLSSAPTDGPALWAAASLLVARLPEAELASGNVTLEGPAWLKYVADQHGDLELVARALKNAM